MSSDFVTGCDRFMWKDQKPVIPRNLHGSKAEGTSNFFCDRYDSKVDINALILFFASVIPENLSNLSF